MFYAAWLHLQRETLIAVNDYTSGCCRLSSELGIWLPERQAQLPRIHCKPWGLTPKWARNISGPASLFSLQGLENAQKKSTRKGLFFSLLIPLSVRRSCMTGKGNDVSSPPALPSVQPKPSRVGVPGLLLSQRAGSHMSPPRENHSPLISSPVLAVASEKLVALSGFKWLLHNTDCQAR